MQHVSLVCGEQTFNARRDDIRCSGRGPGPDGFHLLASVAHIRSVRTSVVLYTRTGGIQLPTDRCARGSTCLESFHNHLDKFIPVNCLQIDIVLLCSECNNLETCCRLSVCPCVGPVPSSKAAKTCNTLVMHTVQSLTDIHWLECSSVHLYSLYGCQWRSLPGLPAEKHCELECWRGGSSL